MSGIPLKSKLNAYEAEILRLRRKRPRVSYRRIAAMLHSKYGVCIQHSAIVKFVKRTPRRNSRKAELPVTKPAPNNPAPWIPLLKSNAPAKPKFEFTYSEHYNLTRLPPEEAAAWRKKLEANGH